MFHVSIWQDVRIEACQLLGDVAREAAYEVCVLFMRVCIRCIGNRKHA